MALRALLISYFQGMRPAVRAVVFVILAMLSFSLMSIFIRYGTARLPTFQVVFFRIFFAVLILVPMLGTGVFRALRTEHFGWHMWRGLVGYGAVVSGFFAIKLIPLAEVTTLGFTIPLFATIGAVVFFGERIRLHRIAALILGFVGVLVVLRPGFESLSVGSLCALANAVAIAISVLMVKQLSFWDRPLAITAWVVILQTPIALIPALLVWEWPDALGWLWLVLIAVFGTVGHLFWTNAVAIAEVSKLQPFEFIKLPVISAAGFLLFDETTSWWVWLGGGLIVLSTVYISRREALVEKHDRQEGRTLESRRRTLSHQVRTPMG